MESVMLQYGILGVVVLGLAGYIIRIELRHAKERKEWNEQSEQHFNRLGTINDETNKVIRENTNILAGLKAILETKK